MQPIEFISIFYFSLAWYTTLLILIWGTVIYYIGSNNQKILRTQGTPSQGAALLLSLLAIFYIGLRPISSEFGDMWLYARNYDAYADMPYRIISLGSEWFWDNIGIFCAHMGFNENEYFLIVEAGYVGLMFVCCWILARKNLWIAMLFFFSAFSFFSYGTNGIRNGLACSLELVALSLFIEKGAKRTAGYILMFIALGIHRSTMLPSAAAIATVYVIRDTKMALRFWLISIFLSLTVGPLVAQVFASLGFDDRMSVYYNAQEQTAQYFSHTGFRWDFLLYSAMPVGMIWYVTKRRRFTDLGYTMIANTYLLCNAFWIMIIRASFSNRFAYLSWFIYPVVFFYPLLRMNIWEDQDRKTSIILFFYSGFTFFMYFIYYFGTTGFKGFDKYWWLD